MSKVKLNLRAAPRPLSYDPTKPVVRPKEPSGPLNVGHGKGATTGAVPANVNPSLGVVGTASSPKEISASKKAVKAIARVDDCDNGDGNCDDGEDRTPRKKIS